MSIYREYHLEKTYGLSLVEFDELLASQEGQCAICRKDISEKPCVDHNHATGKVRGLLCYNCNTGLGLFRDNIALLREAMNYLEKDQVDG